MNPAAHRSPTDEPAPDRPAPLPGARPVRAPRGADLTCKGWQQEAALRMLMNNLDPEVAEDPDHLVVYGGTGRAPAEDIVSVIVATDYSRRPAMTRSPSLRSPTAMIETSTSPGRWTWRMRAPPAQVVTSTVRAPMTCRA